MKTYNNLDMKGRLYDYKLDYKESNNGKGDAITGDISLIVDEEGTVVSLRYFAYSHFNNGKPNATYAIFEDMMAGNCVAAINDAENADWIACTGSIDVSYFIGKNSTDNELARSQKARGSFVNANKAKVYSNKWKLDFLLTKVKEVDADEEKQLDGYVSTTGFLIDDFNKRLMEVQLQARDEKAMGYINGLEASIKNPYFVSTWGKLGKVSRLVVRKNAFGEDEKDEYSTLQWVITGMLQEPYEFGEEAYISTAVYEGYAANLEKHMIERKEAATAKEKENNLSF